MTVGNKKTEACFIANTEFSWGKFHLYTLTNKTKKAFYKKISSRKCRYRSPPEFNKVQNRISACRKFWTRRCQRKEKRELKVLSRRSHAAALFPHAPKHWQTYMWGIARDRPSQSSQGDCEGKNFEKSNIAFSGWLWRCWKRVLHRRATLTLQDACCCRTQENVTSKYIYEQNKW